MTRVAVEEFRIRIGADHKARVEWRGQKDHGDLELDDLRLRTVDLLIGLLRSNRLLQVDELKILGEHLFVTLFGHPPAPGTELNDGDGPAALLRRPSRAIPASKTPAAGCYG
jgi:hypothetical protein